MIPKMTKLQTAKVNMFIAMMLFFDKYAATFTTFLQLLSEITDFKGSYADLQLEIGKQSLKIDGVVETKDIHMDAAIRLLVKSARKARVWAVKTGNATLVVQFDVYFSTFSEMTQAVAINALTTINAALDTNILSLTPYRVLAVDVAAITTAIAAATASIGSPKEAITARVLATEKIVEDIDKCDACLELIDDLLVPEYEDLEEEMVEAYHLSREMTSLGTHATGLNATCTHAETHELLEDVLVTIVEVARSGKTNISGVTLIARMKPGKYHVTCKKLGFVDQTMIVEFALGKIRVLKVAMVPNP